MSEATYYKKNFIQRGFEKLSEMVKGLPSARVNAVAFAVIFFIVLVAFLEYKVFESTYSLTGNIILSASVLGVTAFGGVLAEIVLHRNDKATDDQLLIADWIFYISLLTSAVAGFGIWAQASGTEKILLTDTLAIALPRFASFVFLMVTVVSVVDILLLRAYLRSDVDAVHSRNVARANSKKREAELDVSKKLIDFEADVKSQTESILVVEKRRNEIKRELADLYGGKVPENVMALAMSKLDEIMRALVDGNAPANVFAQEAEELKLKESANGKKPVNPQKG